MCNLIDLQQFIDKYDKCQDEFLNGWCYAFANMLSHKFAGEIYYLPVRNHFICKVEGEYYDVTGKLDKDLIGEHPYKWKDYQRIDKLESARIMRDCIIK